MSNLESSSPSTKPEQFQIDAFAMLCRRLPVALVIRGDGTPAYARSLREQVETLGLDGAVHFLGYTNKRSLQDLYRGAACLVFPSLGEGFGLPVFEALARGLPVITCRVSSLPRGRG